MSPHFCDLGPSQLSPVKCPQWVTGFSLTFTDNSFTPARILLVDEDSDLETRDATPMHCGSLLSASPLPLCLRKSYVENHPTLFHSRLC